MNSDTKIKWIRLFRYILCNDEINGNPVTYGIFEIRSHYPGCLALEIREPLYIFYPRSSLQKKIMKITYSNRNSTLAKILKEIEATADKNEKNVLMYYFYKKLHESCLRHSEFAKDNNVQDMPWAKYIGSKFTFSTLEEAIGKAHSIAKEVGIL